MSQRISSAKSTSVPASGVAAAIVMAATVFAAVLAAGAAILWAHYGTAVFFEMIKSGIAACI